MIYNKNYIQMKYILKYVILNRIGASEFDALLYLQSAGAIGTSKLRDPICNHVTFNLFVPIVPSSFQ